jgi:hypothetical protein
MKRSISELPRSLRSREKGLIAFVVASELTISVLLLGGAIARQHCERTAFFRAESAADLDGREAAYAEAAACYGQTLPGPEERTRRALHQIELMEQTWL